MKIGSNVWSRFLPFPRSTLEALLRARVSSLPGHIQAVYVQNIIKLYAHILSGIDTDTQLDTDPTAKETVTQVIHSGGFVSYSVVLDLFNELQVSELVAERLPAFVSSSELEVQERASSALQLVRYVQKQLSKGQASGLGVELATLFEGELNPVAPKAQRKVQLPEG